MTSNASSLIRTVDEMLLDAGWADTAGLRETLLAVGSLASLPVPEPGSELAALLSVQTHQLARHRLLRKHRTAVVGLAVIAGMGLGVTGVAATGTAPGAQATNSIQQLLQDWAPAWSVAGAPAANGRAANPTEVQPPAEPASPDDAAPVPPENVDPETALPEDGPENAGQSVGTAPAGRGNDTAPGKSKTDDGGAPGNAAGVTPGGAASRDAATQDAATQESNGPARAAAAAAAELEKAGKQVAGTLAEAATAGESLTSALVPPAPTERTGPGNAGPGSNWLRKFNR
ncbi:hypothetical protein QK290_06515 [Pseudarthrobacter sp. AL07]|uniref:hypothetical protein n=1 Tax=unclassified Pseudarthrobacter TaxID=2647000 RepID=UPI00249B3399|nr:MULTISPECIES: hypothetical protein [unclassified Pseudarthrobacter]MDI3194113.1 hypothetical protein [Pseudarthrobacter sp. AL20]MDI3208179.1 hypothetical protein [Pseudarthrobacter sp. AL07]